MKKLLFDPYHSRFTLIYSTITVWLLGIGNIGAAVAVAVIGVIIQSTLEEENG